MTKRRLAAHPRLDLYAAAASTLCLLHCLALPLLATVLPVFAGISGNEQIHKALVLAAAPVTIWVGTTSLGGEGGSAFAVVAVSGLGLLLVATFTGVAAGHEEGVTVVGGGLVAMAHLRRWARRRTMASDASAASACVGVHHRRR